MLYLVIKNQRHVRNLTAILQVMNEEATFLLHIQKLFNIT